jgi:hypothetical protein
MKQVIIIFFLTFFYFNISQTYAQNEKLSASVLNIEYFDICECSSKSPVLARITLEVKSISGAKLKMKNIYSDGITIINEVTNKDKKGNIVFDFCTQIDKKTVFKTVFIDSQGNESNEVFLYVNPVKDKIISGTAPQTFKIN